MDDPCNPKILYESIHGCEVFSIKGWFVFINERPALIAFFLIFFGFVTCFFGKRFFDYIATIIGFIIGFTALMLFFSSLGLVDYLDPFAEEDESLLLAILSIVLSIGVGVLLGYIMNKWAIMVGVLILAIVVGLFIGFTIYNTFLHSLENAWVLIGCALLCAIICGILARKYQDFILMLGTAFLGAYAFVRGFSLFFGHFPSEIAMINTVRNGVELDFESEFYLYLVVMLLIFTTGYCY